MQGEIYNTKDLSLATTLYSLNYLLKGAIRDQQGNVLFQFIIPKDKLHVIDDYWSQQLLVVPQVYHANLRMLRTMINQQPM